MMRIMKVQSKKRYLIILVIFLTIMIFLTMMIYQTTQPKLEYSIESVGSIRQTNLTAKSNENSIELNQIVNWAGSHKPHLEKEGKTLKIIFIRESVVSLIKTYNLTLRISNLGLGNYNIELIYEGSECLYENSKDWEHCSKLDERRLINTRSIFIKSDEIGVEIK